MARKTKADMIEAYRQKIADLETKAADKAKVEAKTAVETLALCDESEAKAREAHAKQVAAADDMLAKKLERITVRREKAQLLIDEVALDESFNQLVLDEVDVSDDTVVNA